MNLTLNEDADHSGSGDPLRLPISLPEAAEQFAAIWANPLAASELAAKLTNSEVWSLAELFTVSGRPEAARQWIDAHKQN